MSRNDEIACLKRLKEAYENSQAARVVFDNTDGVVRNALASCNPNPSENAFPDFLFAGGAMEHFLIGSSKEGKKGSEFNRTRHNEEAKVHQFMDEQKEAFIHAEPAPNTFGTATYETRYEGFTYNAFLESLERNFSSHIESLKKCDTEFAMAIFLMEQQTPRLCTYESGAFREFYLVSRDKRALMLLARYANEVRYVVYCAGDAIEAIDLSKLPKILEATEGNDDIRGGRLIDVKLLLTIDL